MTHDELSIEVNRRLQVALYNGDIPAIHALRAVVEFHKPLWVDCPCEDKNKCPDLTCNTCFNEYKQRKDYPCPTIQAIEKELG